nr:cylicin-1 [Mirounga angustirostris]
MWSGSTVPASSAHFCCLDPEGGLQLPGKTPAEVWMVEMFPQEHTGLRQEINIRTNDNSISINESSRKLWNQDYFTLTFPKPLQPGRKKRSRPSESQISVPRHDKKKLEEVQKPVYIRIRHSLKKISQRPSVYLTVRRQAPFRNPYTLKAHTENGDSKKSKDDKKGRTLQRNSKKNKGPHETTIESKMINDEKLKRGNKADKTPSKLSRKSELSKDSKSKLEINPESSDFKAVSMYPKKDKRDLKNSKETDNEFICAKKDSKDSKNNSDAKSQTCSKNSSNMDFILYLEESGAESMKCDMGLKNYSQNNSKKPSKKDTKKDAKKSSDAESVDSKDARKDAKKDKKGPKKEKKDAKKDTESTDEESADSQDAKKEPKKAKKDSKKSDKKKDAKKDTETSDAESEDSKDAKKDSKKAKKDSKKSDKKKDTKKDAVSTDAETESELETKNWKKDEKKEKKDSKKDDKKKDAKKDVVSTDADSEYEWDSKKDKKVEKKDKRNSKKDDKNKNSKKDDKNKFAMKSEESTETESDWESKKDKYDSKKTKKDSKKDAKKQDAKKGIESTDTESDESFKTDSKKPETFESSDAESEESLYEFGAKKRIADESDATSTDSKKEALELKREFKMSSKKTTFKEKEKKTGTGRVPPSRERPPLPPCEPLLPSPKIKRLCQCKMPPAPLKPRYAPLKVWTLSPKLINDVIAKWVTSVYIPGLKEFTFEIMLVKHAMIQNHE